MKKTILFTLTLTFAFSTFTFANSTNASQLVSPAHEQICGV